MLDDKRNLGNVFNISYLTFGINCNNRPYLNLKGNTLYTIAYLKRGDTILELTGIEDSPVKGFHFCLEVDNFDEAVEKLVKDGVKIIQKPHKATARHSNEEKWQRVVFEGPDAEQIEVRG